MGTSSPRLGLDVKGNLELEIRLRRIESLLNRKADAVDFGDTSDDTTRVTNIPQVTGLRVVGKTPGAITLAWSQVRISNLRRYELDVAEDLAFTTNKQTFNLAGTEHIYSTVETGGGGGNTTVFARVRARSREGNVGPYSVTLNTATGQAQTADIADDSITSDKIDPDDPVKFTGLDDSDVGSKLALRGFIDGLKLSNNSSDSDNDIDIAAGAARDQSNVLSISLTSSLTKRLDGAWAAGTGNGGLASSLSPANDEQYFVFLLSNASGGTVDVGFDTSFVAVNLLADTGSLSLWRRIGCIVTDGAGEDILPFHQYGDYFQWDVAQVENRETPPGTGIITHQLSAVPVGIEFLWSGTFAWQPTDESNWTATVKIASGYDTALAAPSILNFSASSQGDSRTCQITTTLLVPPAATVLTRQTASDPQLVLVVKTFGWWDLRMKDGTA